MLQYVHDRVVSETLILGTRLGEVREGETSHEGFSPIHVADPVQYAVGMP